MSTNLDSDPIPSRTDSDPFAGPIGHFTAELADRMGGASANVADNTVFRYSSGFILDLYDPESGKPRFDRDATLEQMRTALGFIEPTPGVATPRSVFDGSIGNFADDIGDTTGNENGKRLVWDFMSGLTEKLFDEASGEPLYSQREALDFIRKAIDNAPHT